MQKIVDLEECHNKLVTSPKKEERIEACRWLSTHFCTLSNKQTAWNDLHCLINDKEEIIVRWEAVDTLQVVFDYLPDKESAWNDLHNLINDRVIDVRNVVLETLRVVFVHLPDKEAAWKDLIHVLIDEDFTVRKAAAETIGTIFVHLPDKEAAWKDLHGLIHDQDITVRKAAAEIIGTVFVHLPDKRTAWKDLHRLIHDQDFTVKRVAVYALGCAFAYVPDKKVAWKDLRRLIVDDDYTVRLLSAYALGTAYFYIPDKKAAWNAIHVLTHDPHPTVRIRAYHSAGKMSIQTACSLDNDDAFRSELETALRYFEQSSQESVKKGRYNPARICFPLYRAFYTVTFRKNDSKEKADNYLTEAKNALAGSETHEQQLIVIIENLANAIKEVEDLPSENVSAIRSHLITCSLYCTQAEAIIESVERKRPFTAKVMQRGAKIVKHDIDNIKSQIYEHAKEICLMLRGKGSPYDEFGSEIFKFGKDIRVENNTVSVIQEGLPVLKDQISKVPVIIRHDSELSINSIKNSDSVQEQLVRIDNTLKDLAMNVAIYLPNINRNTDRIYNTVRDIDANIDELKNTILSQFSTTEQKIIDIFLSNLNNSEIKITNEIINALINQQISQTDQKEIEKMVQQTWSLIEKIENQMTENQREYADAINNISILLNSPNYSAKHSLLITIPIIPFLVNYTATHEILAGREIKSLWDQVSEKIKRH